MCCYNIGKQGIVEYTTLGPNYINCTVRITMACTGVIHGKKTVGNIDYVFLR